MECTHTIEIGINSIVGAQQINVQAEFNCGTGEFDITNNPKIANASYFNELKNFFVVLDRLNKNVGKIETIEVREA